MIFLSKTSLRQKNKKVIGYRKCSESDDSLRIIGIDLLTLFCLHEFHVSSVLRTKLYPCSIILIEGITLLCLEIFFRNEEVNFCYIFQGLTLWTFGPEKFVTHDPDVKCHTFNSIIPNDTSTYQSVA